MKDITKKKIYDFAKKRAVKKLVKTVPVLGPFYSATRAYQNVQEKGMQRGLLDTALDMTPVVGRAKAVVEFFTGDLIQSTPKMKREGEPLPQRPIVMRPAAA